MKDDSEIRFVNYKIECNTKEIPHFSNNDFIDFLNGDLDESKRKEIIIHLIQKRCRGCIDVFVYEIKNRLSNMRNPSAKYKDSLNLIIDEIICKSADEFQFVLDNKKFLTSEELISNIFEYICKINKYFEKDYLGINDDLRRNIALELYEVALSSELISDMLLSSNKVEVIKLGVSQAIFDTIQFL